MQRLRCLRYTQGRGRWQILPRTRMPLYEARRIFAVNASGPRAGRPCRRERHGLALGGHPHDVPRESQPLQQRDEKRRRVDLVPAQAVVRAAWERVVIVMPRLTQRWDCEPSDVCRVIVRREASPPEEVTHRVHRPRHMVNEEDAYQTTPHVATDRALERE